MDDFLDKIRTSALYVKLNSIEKFSGGVDLDSLLKVLHALNQSYHSFLESNYLHLRKISDVKTIKSEVNRIQKDSDLIIVDLKFESFGAAISPNTITTSTEIKNFEIVDFKSTSFTLFKEEVIFSDYNSDDFLKRIKKKYSESERSKIFAPIINDIVTNKNIKLVVGTKTQPQKKVFRKIRNEKAYVVLAPKIETRKDDTGEKLVKAYMTVSKDTDLFGAKSLKAKKLQYIKEIEADTYPFATKHIEYNDETIQLKTEIEAEVEYSKDGKLYSISYENLDINVWGETRKDAEESFHFMFYQLYQVYFNEIDENLTPEAIKLKEKLHSLIKPL